MKNKQNYEMLDKIKRQLEIIMNHTMERENQYVANMTSQMLNDYRVIILNQLDDDNKELMTSLIKPLNITRPNANAFELSSSQVILRCKHLLELIKDINDKRQTKS